MVAKKNTFSVEFLLPWKKKENREKNSKKKAKKNLQMCNFVDVSSKESDF